MSTPNLRGAILALAIERTGLHRRLALAIVRRGGATPAAMLFAFMAATALISMIVSNTATALIMMPIALAVLHAARIPPGETGGFAGALAMGIAFAATIGGLATLVGSPTKSDAHPKRIERGASAVSAKKPSFAGKLG